MYAIIATGGKQYTVSEGDTIRVEKLAVNAGDTVTFDQVLFVNNGEAKVGEPTVAGATVTASVVGEGRDKKVIVYKYKRKTVYFSPVFESDTHGYNTRDYTTIDKRLGTNEDNFCMDVCEVCYS